MDMRASLRINVGDRGYDHLRDRLVQRIDSGLGVTEVFVIDLLSDAASAGGTTGYADGWEDHAMHSDRAAQVWQDSLAEQARVCEEAIAQSQQYRKAMRKAVDLLFARNREVRRLEQRIEQLLDQLDDSYIGEDLP